MDRARRKSVFMAVAIVGGMGIGLSTIFAVGHAHNASLPLTRIIVGTVIVALAMGWAFYFATRAHFTLDEYKRYRSISASYWGGWFGIGASAPVFFFIAAGGLGRLGTLHIAPAILFMMGYLLPTLSGAIGAVAASIWRRHRDARQ